MYKFKKLFFSTDNDFALWHLASNSDVIEDMLKDKKLNLTLHGNPVSLSVFAYNAYDPNGTSITAQKHRVNFLLGTQDVWIGKWQYDRFCQIEKENQFTKIKPTF